MKTYFLVHYFGPLPLPVAIQERELMIQDFLCIAMKNEYGSSQFQLKRSMQDLLN